MWISRNGTSERKSATLNMSKAHSAIACSLVVGVAATLFFFSKQSRQEQQTPETSVFLPTNSLASTTGPTDSLVSTTEQSSNKRTVPSGMREYRSVAYHFSLLYPQELTVAERQEGGGAITVTFQNVEKAEGFQIFIVPYKEAQVSAERFRKDVPSGVRESLTSVVVDGALGAAFYSASPALGATREVWFVHKGFLYEVTTLKPLEAWFRDILQTWKFLR